MTLTATLARFASRLQIADVPAAMRLKARLHLLDALGCGWAASRTALGEQARQLATSMGGSGRCSIFGGGAEYSLAAAAFANAFIINALDHDDGVEIAGKGMGHPGATLVAAAMAALDAHPGQIAEGDLIAALVAGFEINNRLINALQPSAQSFNKAYGVAQHQSIAGAVVYGRACGFDEQTLHGAMGFAATMACVPSLHKYNWQDRPIAALKDGVAPAAQAGVQAALMAQAGLAGSRDVLDGPQGFWRMTGSDRFDTDALLDGLGERWFLRYGSFKRYPACRWLATALECAETLVLQQQWQATDITRIRVMTFSRIAEDFMVHRPQTATDAQFSLPYTLAATILQIPQVDWYTDSHLHSPALLSLAAKVTAQVDEQLDRRWMSADRQPGATVELTGRDGTIVRHSLAIPCGSASRPMSTSQVLEKARLNVQRSVEDPARFIENLLAAGPDDYRFNGAQGLMIALRCNEALGQSHST